MEGITITVFHEVRKFQLLISTMWILGILCEKNAGASRCQANRLSPGVKIVGPCRYQEKEACKAKCERNGTTVWIKRVMCLKDGQWSATPYCQGATTRVESLEVVNCKNVPVRVKGATVCLKITETLSKKKCPELVNLTLSLDNCSREPGSACKISCDGNRSTLRCLPNGSWSYIPKCVSIKPKICPEPEIIALVKCSRREGERCKFQCPGGKVMEEEITCLSSGMWSLASAVRNETENAVTVPSNNVSELSIISKCVCPSPGVTNGLVTLENCSKKKIGEQCTFTCKIGFAMVGNKTALCFKNLTWSSLPECSDKTCPTPQLSEDLTFKEDCSSKLPGQKCKLGCQGIARLKEKNSFTCINSTHWSKLPYCVCVPPILPDDIKAGEDCQRKKMGETCKLACQRKLTLSNSNFITCQKNGSWTPAPHCERNTCIRPELPSTLRFKENCSSKVFGESCLIECGNVPESYEIVCLNNTQWSEFPKCSCPKPLLSQNVQLKEDCLNKKPGEECKFSCRENLRKHLYITCQNNSVWSEEPSCKKGACPRPQLPSYLWFDEDCSDKSNEETCNLICRFGGDFLKHGYIKCIKGKHWSDFPTCTCPDPKIREDLQIIGDCTLKKPGDSCEVKCKKKLFAPDNSFIICQNDTSWTTQPSCRKAYCQIPKSPTYLSLEHNCTDKTKGGVCEVSCKQGGEIIGQNFITCLETLTWSPFPSCTCAEPPLVNNLLLKHSCKNTVPGNQCQLECIKPFKLVGNPFIRCLRNSSWSSLPMCTVAACLAPHLPNTLIFTETCSDKQPGDNCTLECKEGGQIIGNKFITCLNETHWSQTPKCSCPKPDIKSGLISLSDCSSESPGGKCYLKCEDNSDITGKNFIVCGEDTKWTDQPNCKKNFCKKPKLKPFLVPVDDCSFKIPGDECLLSCEEGGTLMGSGKIKCLNKTQWTKMPECGCPPPLLDDDLEVAKGDCNRKKIGDRCHLKCKESKELVGEPYITCRRNLRWNEQPTCRINICTNPLPPGGILKAKDGNNCFDKTVNSKCALECTEGGKIIGSDTIKCLNRTHWSPLPNCTCPKPELPKHLRSQEDCSRKRIGSTCKISCKEHKKLLGNASVTCERNTKWSPFPLCETIFCPEPFIPREILTENPVSCLSKQPGELCSLVCKEGGTILGNSSITCLNNGSWSNAPDCTCPKPGLGDSLETKEPGGCSLKKRGETCRVLCKNGKKISGNGRIICQNNTRWSRLPHCSKEFCPAPDLPSKVKLSETNCDKKRIGDTCELSCSNGGRIIGDKSIRCLSDLQWSIHPKCTCPELSLSSELRGENCSFMNPGQKCKISCESPLATPETTHITCSEKADLSPQPACKINKCSKPTNLNMHIELIGTCRRLKSFNVGQICKVECENSGKILNGSEITCMAGNRWSKSPTCSCKTPSPRNGLQFHSCEGILPGHNCSVSCIRGEINRNSMLCKRSLSWDRYPTCSCSPPDLGTVYEIRENGKCFPKRMNERCLIGCKNTPKQFYMVCLLAENEMWRGLESCPAPEFCGSLGPHTVKNRMFLLGKTCERNTTFLPGTICEVGCLTEGASFINDPHNGNRLRVECLADGRWKPDVIMCSCPPITPTDTLEVPVDCSKKTENEICDVVCKARRSGKYNNRRFLCKEAQWLIEDPEVPICKEMTVCNNPPNDMFLNGWTLAGHCEGNPSRTFMVGESCPLECTGKVGKRFANITCLSTGTWSTNYNCYCPPLVVVPPLRDTNCSRILPGEKCPLFCDPGFILTGDGYFECAMTLMDPAWRPLPNMCSRVQQACPRPEIGDLHKWTENCDSKVENDTCVIECKEHFVFSRTHSKAITIRCLAGGIWEMVLPCICYPFQSVPGVTVGENCETLLPDQPCRVACVQQQITVLVRCLANGAWETPDCVQARLGRSIISDAVDRLPLGSVPARYQRKSLPCDAPHEMDLHTSCLYLSAPLEGSQVAEACVNVFKIHRHHSHKLLIPWLLRDRATCVWTGIDNSIEAGALRHADGSFVKRIPVNLKVPASGGEQTYVKLCLVMLSRKKYALFVVDCSTLKCPFICERKQSYID